MKYKIRELLSRFSGLVPLPLVALAVLTAFLTLAGTILLVKNTNDRLDMIMFKLNSYQPLEIHVSDVPTATGSATPSAKPKVTIKPRPTPPVEATTSGENQ